MPSILGRNAGRLAAIAVFLFVQASFAFAAEIKVFSTVGVKSVLEEISFAFAAEIKVFSTVGVKSVLEEIIRNSSKPPATKSPSPGAPRRC